MTQMNSVYSFFKEVFWRFCTFFTDTVW